MKNKGPGNGYTRHLAEDNQNGSSYSPGSNHHTLTDGELDR